MTDEEKKRVDELEAAIAAERKIKAELEAKLKERQVPPDDDDPDPFPELKDHDEKITKLTAELEDVKGKVGKTSWAEWLLVGFLGLLIVGGMIGQLVHRRSSKRPAYEDE